MAKSARKTLKNTHNALVKRVISNEYFFPLVCFVLSFIVYFFTLAPIVYWGDAGELTTAAYTLGIPHPSGTPLYVLLGKIFIMIFPFGNIAFRLSVMSALFAALTVMLVYLIAIKLFKNRIAGFFAALAMALAPSFWDYATIGEVYTLSTFLVALNILIVLHWKETKDNNLLYLLSFACGLTLANSITLVLLFPALLYVILVDKHKQFLRPVLNKNLLNKNVLNKNVLNKNVLNKRFFSSKLIIVCILLFLLGLSPYLYLPLRSRMNPSLDWGNPESIQGFINMVSAKEYSEKYLGKVDLYKNIKTAFLFVLFEHSIFTALMLVGIFLFIRTEQDLSRGIFLFLSFIFYFIFDIIYGIGDIITYFLPIYVLTSLFVGFGTAKISDMIKHRPLRYFLLAFLAVFFLVFTLLLYYKELDKSKDFTTQEYSEFIFSRAANNSIILTNLDEHSVLFYYHYVEGGRPDLTITPVQCIKEEYCVQQLKKGNLVIITQNFSAPVSNEDLARFIKEVRPRPVYMTDFEHHPKPHDKSTWVLVLVSGG